MINIPKCPICGKELANPESNSHIQSKFHQDALKKQQESKKSTNSNVAKKEKSVEKPSKETKPKKKTEKKTKTKTKKRSNNIWKNYEKHISTLGKWAWVFGLLNGIVYIIIGIWGLSWTSAASGLASSYGVYSYVAADVAYLTGLYTWYIIGGIIVIILSIVIIKKRFSDRCAARDWDALLDDVLILGNYRIPWMLIFGIVATIFGQWWGGLPILVPAIVIIVWGPREFQWKVK